MRLPDGYTELEYIESTGTQYIDTEFKPNQNTRVAGVFKTIDIDIPYFWWGARTSSETMNFCTLRVGSGIRSDYGESKVKVLSSPSTEKVLIDQSKNICTYATTSINNEISTFVSQYSLFLFAANTGGSAGYFGHHKMYSCQIYDNSNLIRNFIPCINPTGSAGLYDVINGKFYGNAGTGVFISGSPKVTLPNGYTQLEYIESAGLQYIDTGFVPNQDTRVVAEFESLIATGGFPVFGSRQSGSSKTYTFGTTGANNCWLSGYNNSSVNSGKKEDMMRHIVDKNKAVCYLDGVVIATSTYANFASPGTLWIFRFYSGDGDNAVYGKLKMYACKVYDNGILVRDLLPCKITSGMVGLYDIVGAKFYENKGSGAFTAGPEVIWPSNDAIYVKVNGVWKQIDGITIS